MAFHTRQRTNTENQETSEEGKALESELGKAAQAVSNGLTTELNKPNPNAALITGYAEVLKAIGQVEGSIP